MQEVADTLLKVSVTDPAGQAAQASLGSSENCPAAHGVHVAPPTAASVSVVDPGSHWAQAIVETAEKNPGAQKLQCEAPDCSHASEFVTEVPVAV